MAQSKFLRLLTFTFFTVLLSVTAYANNSPSSGLISPFNYGAPFDQYVNFTTECFDPDGYQDIQYAFFYISVNSVTQINSCYCVYWRSTADNLVRIYLLSDNGLTWQGGAFPGTATVLENSQARVDVSGITVSGSGNKLTINWKISFKPLFGASNPEKGLFMECIDRSNVSSGTTSRGTFYIGDNIPQPVSCTPVNGSCVTDTYQSFNTVYSDLDGYSDIRGEEIMINETADTAAPCFRAIYKPVENKLYLVDSAGALTGGGVPGSPATPIENSQGALNYAATSVSQVSATQFRVIWNIKFKKAFAGQKHIFMKSYDSKVTANAYWTDMGLWSIVDSNQAPVGVPNSPLINIEQAPDQWVTFTSSYSDGNGNADINKCLFLVNHTEWANDHCVLPWYDAVNNKLYLVTDDSNIWYGGKTPGALEGGNPVILENSQGRLDCTNTTVSRSGNIITMNWRVNFKSGYKGMKNIYIQAIDNGGLASNWANCGTAALPLAPPTGLNKTTVTQTSVVLIWSDNSNSETGFKTEWGTDGTNFPNVATISTSNTTTYTKSGLTADTQYYFRLCSYNANGQSAYSNVLPVKTIKTAPQSPAGLAFQNISPTQAGLMWTNPSGNNEDGFRVERSTNSGGPYSSAGTTASGVTNFVDNNAGAGLASNTTYYYRVYAFNTGGDSANYASGNVLTLKDKPLAPATLAATQVLQAQVNFSWADNSTNEDGFTLERSTTAAFLPANTVTYSVASGAGTGTKTFNATTNINQNTKYYFRVCAYASNATGQSISDYSNVLEVTTPKSKPAGPTSLAFSNPMPTQTELIWSNPSDNNEEGFRIERSATSGGTYTAVGTTLAGVTTFIDNNSGAGLTPNTTYYYKVYAFNSAGDSTTCASGNMLTLKDRPLAPSTLAATQVLQTQVNFSWTDNSTNEDSFTLERSTSASFPFSDTITYNVTAGTGTGTKTYNATTNIAANTKYYFRVCAYATNATGSSVSAYSSVLEVTTLKTKPLAPTSLVFSNPMSSQAELSWTNPNGNNEEGFRVERSTSITGTYSVAGSTAAGITTFIDNNQGAGLSPNTNYYYRVYAFNNGGDSATNLSGNTLTLKDRPLAPTSLAASQILQTQVNLTWNDNSTNEDGFTLQRSTMDTFLPADTVTYTVTSGVGTGVKTYNVTTSLEANTKYYFRVCAQATNLSGSSVSAYSNVLEATTVKIKPAVPTALVVSSLSTTQISLSWSNPAGNNEEGFRIYRSTSSAGTYSLAGTTVSGVSSFLDDNTGAGLSPGTLYYFRVYAFNNGGESTSYASGNTMTKPLAPTLLAVTQILQTQINLSWNDNSAAEEGFTLERSTADTFLPADTLTYAVTSGSGTGVKTYNVTTNLTQNTKYYFRVYARATSSSVTYVSDYSNVVNATTLKTKPSSPASLVFTGATLTTVSLSWTNPAGNNEEGFRIERSTSLSGTYTSVGTSQAGVTSFTDNNSGSGLASGTAYYYRVYAFNNGGDSTSYASGSKTTLIDPPAKPDTLDVASVTTATVVLTWKDNSDNEAGFKVVRNSGGADTVIDVPSNAATTLAKDVITYTVTGLLPKTNYSFKVCGYRKNSEQVLSYSDYTNTVWGETLNTKPASPTALVFSDPRVDRITLSWTDNSTNEDNFKIEWSGTATFSTILGSYTAPQNTVTYTVTGLSPASSTNVRYYFRICARNVMGDSTYLQGNKATLAASPNPPLNLAAPDSNRTLTSVKLTWTDNSPNEAGFKVVWGTDGISYPDQAVTAADMAEYAVQGLSPNTLYSFKVMSFSINADNDKNYSAEVGPLQVRTRTDVNALVLGTLTASGTCSRPYEKAAFTAVYGHTQGLSNLRTCSLRFAQVNGAENITFNYDVASAGLSVSSVGYGRANGSGIAAIDAGNTTVTVSQASDRITINWVVSFERGAGGKKDISIGAQDTSGGELWTSRASWAVLLPVLCGCMNSPQGKDIVLNLNGTSGVDGLTGRIDVMNSNNEKYKIHALQPETAILAKFETGSYEDLVVDFGESTVTDILGLWVRYHYGTAWAFLNSCSPKVMTAGNIDGDEYEELIADFGQPYGIFIYYPENPVETRWQFIHSLNCVSLCAADIDHDSKKEIIIDFGIYGIWIYDYIDTTNGSWTQLHSISAEAMVSGDVDGDGYDEIFVDFGSLYGLWQYSPNKTDKWTWLHNISPKQMVVCDKDHNGKKDIIVDFGDPYGIYVYRNAGWDFFHSKTASSITAGDLDGNGTDDIIVDFGPEPGNGRWVNYNNGQSWVKLEDRFSICS